MHLQVELRVVPWVFAILAAYFLARGLSRPIDWALAATIVGGFGGVAFLFWAIGWHSLKRVQKVAASITPSTPSTQQNFQSTLRESEELKARALELAAAARPRLVRMTGRGRFHLILLVLAMVLLATLIWASVHDRSGQLMPLKVWFLDWGGLLALLICVATGFGFFVRNRLRERGLLSYGEVATGEVFDQWWHTSPGLLTNRSTVRYSFKDASGGTFQHRCTDASRQLFPGMPLIVFYDIANPARSIGLECSLHDVRTQPFD